MENLKQFIESTCDMYCESMTDQEFNWMVDSLSEKLKVYLKQNIDNL